MEFRGEKDKVRNNQVKRRPDEKHEAESSESAKVSHHKGEKPELGNHGIDTLYSEHESDGLGLETQSSGELEGQSDAVIGLWCTEEHGHQLIEGNTVAIGAVSIMHSAFAVGYQKKDHNLLCKDSVCNDVEYHLLRECLGHLLSLDLSLNVVIIGHHRAQAGR